MHCTELTNFFNVADQDQRIHSMHILLYMALFQKWNLNDLQNPFFISRREMMKLSKIKSICTYHKYIKELQEFGYINYVPSYHPGVRTRVWMTTAS
ncbi:MAG TPA: hypothetical protein VIH86_15815 [Puia sp.]